MMLRKIDKNGEDLRSSLIMIFFHLAVAVDNYT